MQFGMRLVWFPETCYLCYVKLCFVTFLQWNVYRYNSVFLQQDTLENLALEEIDQSNAVLFIHYDADTKMIYLYGKVRLLHTGSHSRLPCQS